MTKKVFINTVSIPEDLIGRIEKGNEIFVVPNTIDIRPFLNNPEKVRQLVEAGKLVFHAWASSWADQWKKPMIASSLNGETVEPDELDEKIPNAKVLGAIIDEVAVPRSEWLDPEWSYPEAPAEIFEQLGIAANSNRSQVYWACDEQHRADIKDKFEHWYTSRLASQHGCSAYLVADGSNVDIL